ncbi:ATP-binding cassette domain-containing protein [Pseudorhodobacter turbinis]|uniref:ATP-binding cassette domain-containing protein n=1 Tax=Pseudorhodobacter turbinis TaxID=2500533 RepID=A0A4P8EGA6_9RHOB|nr:ATP-binding cassette domain-containing protein [Pseudorhodobacter turbinis]QCO56181.1 ATP-binding cassette domain-containing protein [Pseudorhodobacter turbinis]
MLHLDQLTITQGDFRMTADWKAAKGARIAVIGPSGAGKSTLLSVVGGFFAARSGRVLWDGTDLTQMGAGARPITTVFQDQNLFPHLTIAQNLGLGLSPDLRLTRADHTRIAAALDRVGLSGMGARKPAQLSGGQQSRAALARALLRARPILLLDEPFAALGPALKFEMLELVAGLAEENNTCVLMVTHDPQEARSFAPLTCLVAGGIAHAPQSTQALLDNPPPELAAYLG